MDMVCPTAQPASQAAFRQAMRGIAGTAHLVTTSDAAGAWHGMAATAVTSVSMDPPSLLVCINRDATTRSPVEARGAFCVNVLAADHRDHCNRFGSPVVVGSALVKVISAYGASPDLLPQVRTFVRALKEGIRGGRSLR
jgi:flavin reductase (DIM6/NTAB) family NADH-FMN oxidoreductase RutF